MASFGARSLTTVDQHLAQGAITLVRLLQQKMIGEETISHVSPPDLIVRSSA
jgi:DNA-binding LacI/PurR family transcriptional regulator